MALMQFANPKSRIGKDAVEAELKFIDPAGGVPVTYAYEPPARTPQSRLRKFEQVDKWSFCLTAGTLVPANQERR
jgi:hypothetical protein